MTALTEQLAVEKNKRAVELRDQGFVEEAQKVLLDNATHLAEEAAKYDSKFLEKLSDMNRDDAKNLDDKNWKKQRKSMRQQQYKLKKQQKY